MKRRGILGMFGAGAAAAAAPADLTAQTPPSALRAVISSSIGYDEPVGRGDAMARSAPWTQSDSMALNALRRKLQTVERDASRRSYARERTLTLCGGHAPHIAACHSWAPWFKAQATVRWQLAQEAEQIREERRRARSIAEAFSNLIRDALPEWLRDKLVDDE